MPTDFVMPTACSRRRRYQRARDEPDGHESVGEGRCDDPRESHAGIAPRDDARHAAEWIWDLRRARWPDGPADYASGPALNPAPYNWVKRVGNELTGYASADGQTWTPVSAATITGLLASVSIGLAVTSTDNLQASTVTFDNVRIVGSSPTTNQAPILTQPANQTSTRGTFASLQLQASDVTAIC